MKKNLFIILFISNIHTANNQNKIQKYDVKNEDLKDGTLKDILQYKLWNHEKSTCKYGV